MEDLSFQIAVVVKKAGKLLVANSIKGAVAARISTTVVSLVMAAL